MEKIYKWQPCFTSVEARKLGQEKIYEQAEVLRANLRIITHIEIR